MFSSIPSSSTTSGSLAFLGETLDQVDLFGEPSSCPSGLRRNRPKAAKNTTTVPVINAGMFELNDTLSAERFSANYISGASAYWDCVGLANAGCDIGVVADKISHRTRGHLRTVLKNGHRVFCDSGAYSARAKYDEGIRPSPVADFDNVFAVYEDLLADVPRGLRFNLAVVGPDVLKDWEQSMAVLLQYRANVMKLIASGVNLIIPIQQGPVTANETLKRIVAILGTKDFTVGIPSAAAALSLSDVATIRDFGRFHILGRGTMNLALYRRAYAFLHNCAGAYVSCDANRLRKNTAEIGEHQRRLVEQGREGVMQEGMYDETELLYEVLHMRGWMPKRAVKSLAAFYGVTAPRAIKEWLAAHADGDEALAPLIEEHDPEALRLMSCGLRTVFGEAALKELSASMRAIAVESVFASPVTNHISSALAA